MEEHQSQQTSKAAERERAILNFWKESGVFRKSVEKEAPQGEFVFYDGPPFATGLPHYGNLLAGTIKDVIPRYKTMCGFRVPRRWGWDCHGLPVENEVEKELGFKSKKDIVDYGIEKFNALARQSVLRYANEWREYIERTGRWVDMQNDYRTMDSGYTESVWSVFKTLHEKGLIYEGFKSMHLCPRCETTLSNFEVSQGYKDITDLSVYIKFPIRHPEFPNTYVVAWTTTPWTLPGNVALAVHPEHDYAFVEITASNAPEFRAGDTYIVGADESVLRRVFGGESNSFTFDAASRTGSFSWNGEAVSFRAEKGVSGKELSGLSYEPLFDYYKSLKPGSDLSKAWRIYNAPFVAREEGTGIVHIAPAFGEDDYELARREGLPFVQHVESNGMFRSEVRDFVGLHAKPKGNPRETDEKIAATLAARGLLLKKENVVHPYPHCWRCETPLLNYAAPSWFVKVSELREKLVEANKQVRWVPESVGEYRFGNWLAEARDWAISRSRFWGAPIPAWRCLRCKSVAVVGSLDELRRKSKNTVTKLVLTRHGESVKNRTHVFDDSPNAFALTHEGARAAKEAARRIEAGGGVDVIFSSPVRRARETAEAIGARLGKGVIVDERVREVDSGAWDGKREDDPAIAKSRAVYNALPADEYYRAKRGGSGESWEAVEQRMQDALKEILVKHSGESILIVSHEGPLVYLLKTIKGLSFAEADALFKRDALEAFANPITVYLSVATGREIDLHRPFIDEMLLHCDSCARETGTGENLMRRVPEVFDCWFESGAMPYAQAHYPFEHDGAFDPVGGWFRRPRGFPAHFIAEGLDQTRGWFYSLLVLGVGLFERSPYEAVVVNGIILAEDGQKMSKRLKNYTDPLALVEKYGADALRYYLLSSPAVRGEDLRFSERGVDEVAKKVLNRLDNVLQFYRLYTSELHTTHDTPHTTHILDRWIVARLNQLIVEVTAALEAYELDRASRPIADFIEDLSTWYLRRSRERIKSTVLEEKEAALGTLGFVLGELSKIMAPFTPFFAEYLFQELNTNSRIDANDTHRKSVHLEEWPKPDSRFPPERHRRAGKIHDSRNILEQMAEVRRIISFALEARAKANIKVRQPLASLSVKDNGLRIKDYISLIKDEVNVKEVFFDAALQNEVELDTVLTPELKDEGQFRELVRMVQDLRKKLGLRPRELADLMVVAEGASRRFVEQREAELQRLTALRSISFADSLPDGETFRADEIAFSFHLVKAE